MNTSLIRLSRLVALVSLSLGTLTGCADIVTYGKDSRAAGLKLMQQENYPDAAGAFRNAVRQNPRDYQSYCYLGQAYSAMHHYQMAIPAFNTSLEIMNDSLEGRENWEFRQDAHNGLAGAIAKCDTRDVETDAVQNSARKYGAGEKYFLLAKIYVFRGDPDLALENYHRAAATEPQNFYIQREYGLYLERLGQKQNAVAFLQRAYLLKSEDRQTVDALRRLGVVPGPSLMAQDQLASPPIPKGPIPEVPAFQRTPEGSRQDSAAQMPRD